MARASHFLLALLALSAAALPARAQGDSLNSAAIESVLMEFIKDLSRSLGPNSQRRLLALGDSLNVQGFLGGLMGHNWTEHFPHSWSLPSFDWAHLGEFEYDSNWGDFVESQDLASLTEVHSMQDLHNSLDAVEAAFCTPESFKPSKLASASCTGPVVKLEVTPKICTLDSKNKQVLCEPAKLVLTKTPGSCTHKYHSASKWTGKECKVNGTMGFVDEQKVGGANKTIPLHQLDLTPPTPSPE